jgi:hypothetical protein
LNGVTRAVIDPLNMVLVSLDFFRPGPAK